MLTQNWDGNSDRRGDRRHYYLDGCKTYVAEVCVEAGRPGKWETQLVLDLETNRVRSYSERELGYADLEVAW
jgi:hypothetical protein